MNEQIEEIRRAIRTGEVSQNQLAKRAGVSHRTIGAMMDADANPTIGKLGSVYDALKRLREEPAEQKGGAA
jgi:predicted transcriptional regulator